MPTLSESFPGMIAALADRYGHPVPSPVDDDAFRRILAVALARSVDPGKAGRALDGLREAGLLEPAALAEADARELTDLVREARGPLPAQAVGALQRLARWVVQHHGGSAEGLREVSTGQLREELLGLNGIGPPSADAILLLALGRAVYPVDRASYRILVRHGWIDPTAEYDEARDALERPVGDDPGTLARLSDWLDRVGREACRPAVAKCERCPLRPFLPEGGPRHPE